MEKFKKVVRIGTTVYAHGFGKPLSADVFCKIEFADGRLSISGVEGPLANGDARGSCGQIEMSMKAEDVTPAPAWSAEQIAKFLEIWRRWHLNDMRAGCEHQREVDVSRKVEIVTYGLTTEAMRERDHAIVLAARAGLSGVPVELTETARALATLKDWFKDRFSPPDADSPLSGCFEVKKREQKAIGWVKREEHPEGMLSTPCPTCGYKYGSAWLKEEVPAEVLAWLWALPDTDKTPAWV